MARFELDCMGEACPIPLIKTEKKMEGMEIGDTIVVSVDHSCAIKNIPEWGRKIGYNVEVDETGEGEWDIIVKKTI